jgi:hypothetical protein
MGAHTKKTIDHSLIEIFPPKSKSCRTDVKTCLCCQQQRSAAAMDDDGCGICEECLSP